MMCATRRGRRSHACDERNTPGISGIDIMDVDPARRYEEVVERCGQRLRCQVAIG